MKRNEQKAKEIRQAIKRIKMGEKAWNPAPIKKASKQGLPTIKILSERKVTMVELNVDISDGAKKALLKIAKDGILKDEQTMLSWAFKKSIEHSVKFWQK